tara:strand:+ start:1331 stop:2323 length:993 start_codon:yes stop_codon:yes gene_type:complete
MLNNKTILITGGTGSFGNAFVSRISKLYKPKKLIIYSRDEYKQFHMQKKFSGKKYNFLRFFIGDVRDLSRLQMAMKNVDYVIHAAALKHVPIAEYNPIEYVKTNIIGAQNIIEASLACKVKKIIALSTDKAANPINLYGATKLASDKLFVTANSLAGSQDTKFAVVRYGNVVGSRGSVAPYFKSLIESGQKTLPITHKEMTRFWITLEQAVNLVVTSFKKMIGGEIIVPKIPSIKVVNLAKSFDPKINLKIIGVRPGEKIHELMCPNEFHHLTFEFKKYFLILNDKNKKIMSDLSKNYREKPKKVEKDFEYSSGNNQKFLSIKEIKKLKF